jgi:hypothetical protein
MKLRRVEHGANLIFLLPYYKHSVFYGKQRIRRVWVVSDLQLYLDLHNYPIRGSRPSISMKSDLNPSSRVERLAGWKMRS